MEKRAESEEAIASNVDSEDIIISAMRAYGFPLNRETYLVIAYLGEPAELSAEERADIPNLPSEIDIVAAHGLGLGVDDDCDGWSDVDD